MFGSEEIEYKRITHTFFEKDWKEGFDIFYQVPVDGEKKFVKFAVFDPRDYSRLNAILSEKQNEQFYIREIDLHKAFRGYSYTPEQKFYGYQECYEVNIYDIMELNEI